MCTILIALTEVFQNGKGTFPSNIDVPIDVLHTSNHTNGINDSWHWGLPSSPGAHCIIGHNEIVYSVLSDDTIWVNRWIPGNIGRER